MPRHPQDIPKEALALSTKAAWQAEIRRRLAELDSQAVSLVSWSEVRSRLKSALSHTPQPYGKS
jgi:putative addiction module component (TIGR02574 family)